MIDEKLKRLINQEIDGVLSQRQRAQLKRKLTHNPEARAYRADMQRLADALSAVPQEAPPPHFKKSIMNRVRASNSKRPARQSKLAAFAGKLANTVDRRIGLAFAFGCAFALLLLVILGGDSGINLLGPHAQMVGALRPAGPQAHGRSIDLDLDGGATLQIYSDANLTFLTITLARTHELDMLLQFSAQDLEIIEMRREPGAAGTITVAPASLAVSASRGVYQITLRKMTQESAELKITAHGQDTNFQQTILLEGSR